MKSLIQIFLLTLSPFILSFDDISNYKEEGYARFYPKNMENFVTASNKLLKHSEHYAAHKSLPFGTDVKVTNLENGRCDTVTVIDRGPYDKSKVIELTDAVASKLDCSSDDVVRIKIEVIGAVTDMNNEFLIQNRKK